MQINYLLGRTTEFRGLSTPTTNPTATLDAAFLPRTRFAIHTHRPWITPTTIRATCHEPPAGQAHRSGMLFMVIERFRDGDPSAVGARFRARGRLMPEGLGLAYVSSWMAADGASCYQLMEAPGRGALEQWMANWSDLVDFEVVEVMPSADFWARRT